MSSRILHLLFALLVLGGCSLNRSVLSTVPGSMLEVTPTLACRGDTITLEWDLQPPANPAFCRFANGNTPALQRCGISSECGEGAQCIDGSCNRCALIESARTRETDCAVPSDGGCPPNMNARILISPEPEPPLENASDIWNEHRGQRQFVVEEPTQVEFFSEMTDAEGTRAGVPSALGRFDASRQVEIVDPDLTRTLNSTYACRGSPVWAGTLLEQLFRVPSDSLSLIAVRNPSSFAVVVSGLDAAPFTLAPGASRTLNLPVLGLVGARPDPAFLSTLPPVFCSAVQDGGRYPDAPLELTVGCPPRLSEPPLPSP